MGKPKSKTKICECRECPERCEFPMYAVESWTGCCSRLARKIDLVKLKKQVVREEKNEIINDWTF